MRRKGREWQSIQEAAIVSPGHYRICLPLMLLNVLQLYHPDRLTFSIHCLSIITLFATHAFNLLDTPSNYMRLPLNKWSTAAPPDNDACLPVRLLPCLRPHLIITCACYLMDTPSNYMCLLLNNWSTHLIMTPDCQCACHPVVEISLLYCL